jgi:beta-glucosidase
MKKLLFTQIVVASLFVGQSVFAQEKLPQFGKDPIKEIVKKMSLEDKVKVVVGKGFSVPGLNMPGG